MSTHMESGLLLFLILLPILSATPLAFSASNELPGLYTVIESTEGTAKWVLVEGSDVLGLNGKVSPADIVEVVELVKGKEACINVKFSHILEELGVISLDSKVKKAVIELHHILSFYDAGHRRLAYIHSYNVYQWRDGSGDFKVLDYESEGFGVDHAISASLSNKKDDHWYLGVKLSDDAVVPSGIETINTTVLVVAYIYGDGFTYKSKDIVVEHLSKDYYSSPPSDISCYSYIKDYYETTTSTTTPYTSLTETETTTPSASEIYVRITSAKLEYGFSPDEKTVAIKITITGETNGADYVSVSLPFDYKQADYRETTWFNSLGGITDNTLHDGFEKLVKEENGYIYGRVVPLKDNWRKWEMIYIVVGPTSEYIKGDIESFKQSLKNIEYVVGAAAFRGYVNKTVLRLVDIYENKNLVDELWNYYKELTSSETPASLTTSTTSPLPPEISAKIDLAKFQYEIDRERGLIGIRVIALGRTSGVDYVSIALLLNTEKESLDKASWVNERDRGTLRDENPFDGIEKSETRGSEFYYISLKPSTSDWKEWGLILEGVSILDSDKEEIIKDIITSKYVLASKATIIVGSREYNKTVLRLVEVEEKPGLIDEILEHKERLLKGEKLNINPIFTFKSSSEQTTTPQTSQPYESTISEKESSQGSVFSGSMLLIIGGVIGAITVVVVIVIVLVAAKKK